MARSYRSPGPFAWRLLLAALLLVAWQNALRHPLVHFDSHGAFVHAGTDSGSHAPAEKKGSNSLCDAIAAVAACVAGHAAVAAVAPAAASCIVLPGAVARNGTLALAYRSQAPPSPV